MSHLGVLFTEFARRWRASLAGLAQLEDYGTVNEGDRSYPLLTATVPGRRSVLITGGFHGDEKAGPLTLLQHAPEIVAYARARDIGLRIYPCINPSGFEAHTRYNLSGERPNNDFLQYEVEPGRWKGELSTGEPYLRWSPSRPAAKETAALRASLAGLPHAESVAGPAPGQLHPRRALLLLCIREPGRVSAAAGPVGREGADPARHRGRLRPRAGDRCHGRR